MEENYVQQILTYRAKFPDEGEGTNVYASKLRWQHTGIKYWREKQMP